jgi:hypothetical protein
VVGTIFERIDVSTNLGQIVDHCPMKCFNVCFLVAASGKARLVCYDEYKVTSIIGGLLSSRVRHRSISAADLEYVTTILVTVRHPGRRILLVFHFAALKVRIAVRPEQS